MSYIVHRMTTYGGLDPMRPATRIHSTFLEAKQESERLAAANPTVPFAVFELAGTSCAEAPKVTWKEGI